MTKNIASALIPAALTAGGMTQTPAAPASDFAAAQKQFDSLCEGCHGEGGNGGDRAPRW
jgi:mono/diheme cytochrome c family protein